MEIFFFNPNTKLVAVYYNGGKPPHLFRIDTDVTLFGFKGQLDQTNCQLNYRDTQRVDSLKYRRPSTDSVGNVRFNRMKLLNDENVRAMFSIFGHYSTRGPIELDASLVSYVDQIQKKFDPAQELRRDQGAPGRTTRRH